MNRQENEKLIPAVDGVRDAVRALRDARHTMAAAVSSLVAEGGDVSVRTKEWYLNDSSDASLLENAPAVEYMDPDTGVLESGAALGVSDGDEGTVVSLRRIDGNSLDEGEIAVPIEDVTNPEELYDLF